jgi:hypothetical protein
LHPAAFGANSFEQRLQPARIERLNVRAPVGGDLHIEQITGHLDCLQAPLLEPSFRSGARPPRLFWIAIRASMYASYSALVKRAVRAASSGCKIGGCSSIGGITSGSPLRGMGGQRVRVLPQC